MKKKEQFSIALWDRLQKDNIPHTFESRGRTEITNVTKFDNSNIEKPIAGIYMGCVDTWDVNGVYYNNDTTESDLFIVWEEEQLMLEGWINVYEDGCVFHDTIDDAEQLKGRGRIACVPVSIPYTKGEGLNEPTTN